MSPLERIVTSGQVNLIQITPGAGGMYCGNCFRDNALVSELRRQGHDTVMVPMYLPLTLDEVPAMGDSPTFFGGINVYLQQKMYNWLLGSSLYVFMLVFKCYKAIEYAKAKDCETYVPELAL